MRRGASLVASLTLLTIVAAVPAHAARSLNNDPATVQLSAKMTTTWSLGPYESSEDSCFLGSTHGSGKQIVEVRQPGHANVTIVDFGGTIAFQLPVADRASPTKRAPGFPIGNVQRDGVVEEDFSYARNSPSLTCGAPPEPNHRDESGCGERAINWDILPLVSAGRLYPNVETFPPTQTTLHCPFFGVPGKTDPNPATLPNKLTYRAISAAEVRRALGRRHGKLILQGSEEWKGRNEPSALTVATTESWKLTIIRASGH